MELTLFFDGAAEPTNPGLGSYGFLIRDPRGVVVHSEGGYLGPGTTNNVAEYVALGKGLRWLADHRQPPKHCRLLIRGDSKLVVEQLAGRWQCRAANLQPLLARCRELLGAIGCRWEAAWIPRDENHEADALSVKAWEEGTNKPFPHRVRT